MKVRNSTTSFARVYKSENFVIGRYYTKDNPKQMRYFLFFMSKNNKETPTAEVLRASASQTPDFRVSEGTANLLQAFILTKNQLTKTLAFATTYWGTNRISDTGNTMKASVTELEKATQIYLQILKNCVWENIEFELAGAEGLEGERLSI